MITELKKGFCYRWVGEKKRPKGFAIGGAMDFIMDGKPHLYLDNGHFADDPSYSRWNWTAAFPYLEELGQLTTKEWEKPFPWWWTGKPTECWAWDEDPEDKEITWIYGVVPDCIMPFLDKDDFYWKNAEPRFPENIKEEFYLTKKLNGEIKAETKLTEEQLKELGL